MQENINSVRTLKYGVIYTTHTNKETDIYLKNLCCILISTCFTAQVEIVDSIHFGIKVS